MAENAMTDAEKSFKEESPEVQEVLRKLADKGHEVPGITPEAQKPDAAAEAEAKANAEAAAKADADAEAAKEAQAKKDAAAGKHKDKNGEQPAEREARHVPVSKYNDERHKRQDAETKAQEAEARALAAEERAKAAEVKAHDAATHGNRDQAQVDKAREMAEEMAKKHRLSPEFTKDFIDTIEKIAAEKAVLPKDLQDQLETLKGMREEADALKREKAQDQYFEKEFDEVAKKLPQIADRKNELKTLAFSEGKTGTSLFHIALEFLHDNPAPKPGRKTMERSGNDAGSRGEAIDFSSLTKEQLASLTPAQREEWIKWCRNN